MSTLSFSNPSSIFHTIKSTTTWFRSKIPFHHEGLNDGLGFSRLYHFRLREATEEIDEMYEVYVIEQ